MNLIIENKKLPKRLEVIAKTEDEEIMGIKVKGTSSFGIQFHPESILTKEGKRLLKNFLKI